MINLRRSHKASKPPYHSPTHPRTPAPKAITSATSDPLPTATATPSEAVALALPLPAARVPVGWDGLISVFVVAAEVRVKPVSVVALPDAAEEEAEMPEEVTELIGPPGVRDVMAEYDGAAGDVSAVRLERLSRGSETASLPRATAVTAARGMRRVGRVRCISLCVVLLFLSSIFLFTFRLFSPLSVDQFSLSAMVEFLDDINSLSQGVDVRRLNGGGYTVEWRNVVGAAWREGGYLE